MARRWIAIGVCGLLAAGVAAAVALMGAADRTPPHAVDSGDAARDPETPVTRAEFDELRAAVEFELQARSAIAEEVASLRRALEDAGGIDSRPSAAPALPKADAPAVAAGASETTDGAPGSTTADTQAGFDSRGLALAGLSDADVERLRARWEAFELEKLELNNLGLREGWKGRRFRQEQRALETALRLELGDEWDAYLFATGRQNRVRVNNVLEDSLASAGGFEEGDMILSYDRQRIYQPGELQSKTAACADGAFARVEVLRDGRLDTLRVPCGPLGVLVDHVKQPPLAP